MYNSDTNALFVHQFDLTNYTRIVPAIQWTISDTQLGIKAEADTGGASTYHHQCEQTLLLSVA